MNILNYYFITILIIYKLKIINAKKRGVTMIPKKLKKCLEDSKIKFQLQQHEQKFTVQEISEATHFSSSKMAKTLILSLGDGKFVMAVLPGNRKLNLEAFRNLIHSKTARLANESEFKRLFNDCETGAMPPFGNLYGIQVYVDDTLQKSKEIGFNAGSHSEIIKMKYNDYESLVHPMHGNFIQ